MRVGKTDKVAHSVHMLVCKHTLSKKTKAVRRESGDFFVDFLVRAKFAMDMHDYRVHRSNDDLWSWWRT